MSDKLDTISIKHVQDTAHEVKVVKPPNAADIVGVSHYQVPKNQTIERVDERTNLSGREYRSGHFQSHSTKALLTYLALRQAEPGYQHGVIPMFVAADTRNPLILTAKAIVDDFSSVDKLLPIGHCRHTADLDIKPTPEYQLFEKVFGKAYPVSQELMIETLEELSHVLLASKNPDGEETTSTNIIQQFRQLEVSHVKKSNVDIQDAAQKREGFESISIQNAGKLPPNVLTFECEAYDEFPSNVMLTVRVRVRPTEDDDIVCVVTPVRYEQIKNQLDDSFVDHISKCVEDTVLNASVMPGAYKPVGL